MLLTEKRENYRVLPHNLGKKAPRSRKERAEYNTATVNKD